LRNSLHRRVRRPSKEDRVSINQLVTTAVAEKISALETEEFLAARADRASRRKFKETLSAVPHTEPAEHDAL